MSAHPGLRRALDAADDRLVVGVLVLLTGDDAWMAEPYRSCFAAVDGGSGGLVAPEAASGRSPTGDADELRRRLRDALAAELTAERPTPPLPGDDVLARLATFLTGVELAPSYVAYLRDTLDPAPMPPVPAGRIPSIVIIGAGFCGLAMAIRLRQLGLPFRLLEKHGEVGGVWHENSYPGCGVDSPNHLYSFATHIHSRWTRYFARREEILRYIADSAAAAGATGHISFDTEVRSMRWSEPHRAWHIHADTPDGPMVIEAEVVVTALGSLNQPKYPEIPRIDRFAGPVFHTARWRHDVELAGTRIGMIGNGSSGFQVGPTLAQIAGHLTSFQRSPAWAAPNPLTNAHVPEEVGWLLERVPHYARLHRFVLYWSSGDAGYGNLVVDRSWAGPGVSEANERIRRRLAGYLRSQVGDRDDLYAKLLPDYPPFTKRMVVDNGWFAALTRPNVSLVTEEIVEATPSGLVTADGTHHDLDVLIHATGFWGTRFLWPTEVRGRSGRTPAEIVGRDDDIRAYLGTALADFPNLFAIFGPNSSIGHGGSAVHVAECQANYIANLILAMIQGGIATVEVRPDVCAAYNAEVDRDLRTMVWDQPGMRSRYRNAEGRVVTNHPWTLQRFWELTRTPNLDDYEIG